MDSKTGQWRSVRAWRRRKDLTWAHAGLAVCGVVICISMGYLAHSSSARISAATTGDDLRMAIAVAAFIGGTMLPIMAVTVGWFYPMMFQLRWDRRDFRKHPAALTRLDAAVAAYRGAKRRRTEHLDALVDVFVAVTKECR